MVVVASRDGGAGDGVVMVCRGKKQKKDEAQVAGSSVYTVCAHGPVTRQ